MTLKAAVQKRIAAADRKVALVRDTFDAYNQFRTIWTPKFEELKRHILLLSTYAGRDTQLVRGTSRSL